MTGIEVQSISSQKIGDIKTRSEFSSQQDGIDSNTISAGEDNVLILICALISLKYYFNSIESKNIVESILLIDEFDATLHPSLQFKLIDFFRKYSKDYKIQVIFTTHSISLLEYALKNKDNVMYLIDNLSSVILMDSPDIYKIKMFLENKTKKNIYVDKFIPIFTEDDEARTFLNILFDFYETKDIIFSSVRNIFHLVQANIGASNLINIFADTRLRITTMKAICILDGDQRSDLNKCMIKLPGDKSPEKIIMEYSQILYKEDNSFWKDETILDCGYGKKYYRDHIMPDINKIEKGIIHKHESLESTHGIERELRKKNFIKHKDFFELLFRHWINNTENSENIKTFL